MEALEWVLLWVKCPAGIVASINFNFHNAAPASVLIHHSTVKESTMALARYSHLAWLSPAREMRPSPVM